VLLTGAGAGIGAAVLTRLLQLVQHLVWPGPDLLDAAAQAGAWRHVVVLLGAGLLTGAGQIILHRLSSANGIDISEAISLYAGRRPLWARNQPGAVLLNRAPQSSTSAELG
jgi:H+/Cl- antiporter ClcA